MKTLEQIQQENKKFILEAIHDCIYYESARDGIIIGKPLTLSRVLLAGIKSGKCMDCFEHKNNKHCTSGWHVDSKENTSRVRVFILDNWNLEKETLEEQTEETQRRINKLFND